MISQEDDFFHYFGFICKQLRDSSRAITKEVSMSAKEISPFLKGAHLP